MWVFRFYLNAAISSHNLISSFVKQFHGRDPHTESHSIVKVVYNDLSQLMIPACGWQVRIHKWWGRMPCGCYVWSWGPCVKFFVIQKGVSMYFDYHFMCVSYWYNHIFHNIDTKHLDNDVHCFKDYNWSLMSQIKHVKFECNYVVCHSVFVAYLHQGLTTSWQWNTSRFPKGPVFCVVSL